MNRINVNSTLNTQTFFKTDLVFILATATVHNLVFAMQPQF